jgi:hypothetical protein
MRQDVHMVPGFDPFTAIPVVMIFMFGLFGLFFVGVVTFIIVAIVKNVQKAKELGKDPFTMETELTARAIDSQILAPEQSLEQRLAELDGLRDRGVITAEEHAKARAEAISAL